MWSQTGLRLYESLVILPLAELEKLRGNGAREASLRGAAQSLSETIDRFGPSWVLGAVGLAGDPRDLHLLVTLARDSTVPPGFRSVAVEASGDGVCLNPREWLSGGDDARSTRDPTIGTAPLVPAPFRAHGPRALIRRIRYCTALTTP